MLSLITRNQCVNILIFEVFSNQNMIFCSRNAITSLENSYAHASNVKLTLLSVSLHLNVFYYVVRLYYLF
jgi:hypothetical protein